LPKITNERYKTFFDSTKEFIEYSMEEFETNLKQIKYTNPYKQEQARCLAIALYYTGFRPIEVIGLMPHHINKSLQDITITMKGAKHGIEGTIVLPSDKYTKELYDYAKKQIPEYYIFNEFYSKYINKPKYKRFNKFTQTIDEVKGSYNAPAHNVYYFIKKWFNVNPYYFRHSRFTQMIKAGASIEEVRLAKLGRTEFSTRAYVKYDIHDAKKRKKYYPKF